MKNIPLIILTIVLTSLGASGARNAELPAIYDGSMSLYDFAAVEPRILPDSLSPIHISYIARHGARYLTSEKKVIAVEKALEKARRVGSLTRSGEECLKLMQDVRLATAGQWGMLSEIGIRQELRLGREMVRMFPEAFSRGDEDGLTAVSSYVPRVIETMDRFIIAIADTVEGIGTSASSGKRYDYLTRFFVSDPAYDAWRLHGEWKYVYEDFATRTLPTEPALRLIGEKAGFDDAALRSLSYDLYKVLQGLRAMGMNPPTTQWMTPDEYRRCWEATNLEKYFQYSISPLSCIPAQGAADLLFHLIQEQTRLTGNPSAGPSGLTGIFGHAETLLPIFALLGVPGTTALPLDYDTLPDVWSDAVLTPLAANLAIIYSRSGSGALYASMRLNGRNVSPVNNPQRMWVSVSELREYWLNRYLQLMPRTK